MWESTGGGGGRETITMFPVNGSCEHLSFLFSQFMAECGNNNPLICSCAKKEKEKDRVISIQPTGGRVYYPRFVPPHRDKYSARFRHSSMVHLWVMQSLEGHDSNKNITLTFIHINVPPTCQLDGNGLQTNRQLALSKHHQGFRTWPGIGLRFRLWSPISRPEQASAKEVGRGKRKEGRGR